MDKKDLPRHHRLNGLIDWAEVVLIVSSLIYMTSFFDPKDFIRSDTTPARGIGGLVIALLGIPYWGKYFLPIVIVSGVITVLLLAYKALMYPKDFTADLVTSIKGNKNILIGVGILAFFFLMAFL